jgi:hypothetical protein
MDDNFGFSLLNEITTSSMDHYLDSPVDLPVALPTFDCAGQTATISALNAHLCIHSLSRSEFYLQISAVTPELLGPTAPLRAHTDGGSMATTTNRKEYLWDYRDLSPEERRPVLRVADSRAHHPIGIGSLHVPTTGTCATGGYHVATCYYTPSLPATILSPRAVLWPESINALEAIRLP